MTRRTVTRLVAVASLVLSGVVLAVVISSKPSKELRVAFTSATNMFPGLEVRIAGRKVGEVTDSAYVDGHAHLKLRIEDDGAWPLHRGTQARIRYGTTAGVYARFVELTPGPSAAPALPDGGLIGSSDSVTPVEFDQVYDIVDRDAQGHLKGFMAGAAASFGDRGPDLAASLRESPGALDAGADLLAELGADPRLLQTLVASGSATARAVATHDGQLREALTAAAETFDETALQARSIEASLDRLPGTLRASRSTLARTDRSLVLLDALVADVRPGAAELAAAVPVLRRAVATLRSVAPSATRTLRAGTAAAPDIEALLRAGVPFASRLRPVLDESVPALRCIRPFTPDLQGWVSNWAGFTKNYDAREHYFRVLIQARSFGNAEQGNSAALMSRLPGLTYSYPRPPGQNADQPWFQPNCGSGPEANDPTKDPEALQ